MWDATAKRNFQSFASNNLVKEPSTSTFSENVEASFENELASGLTISRFLMEAPLREQKERITKLANSDSDLAQFRKTKMGASGYPESTYDFEEASDYLVARGDKGFQSMEELNVAVSDSVKQADNYSKYLYEKAGAGGVTGQFVGAIGAQVAEPVNYVAVIPGIGQASLMSKIAVGAAEGAGATALTIPTVKAWKNENDIEYTYKQAALDVGLSAAFGGTLAGLVGYTGQRIAQARAGREESIILDEVEMFEASEQRLVQFQEEATQGQALNEETGEAFFNRLDDEAKYNATAEDNWVEELPTISRSEETTPDVEQVELEEALGIKREAIRDEEGIERGEEVLNFNEKTFNFEIDGKNAVDVVKDTDKQLSKIDQAINCMLGGGK